VSGRMPPLREWPGPMPADARAALVSKLPADARGALERDAPSGCFRRLDFAGNVRCGDATGDGVVLCQDCTVAYAETIGAVFA